VNRTPERRDATQEISRQRGREYHAANAVERRAYQARYRIENPIAVQARRANLMSRYANTTAPLAIRGGSAWTPQEDAVLQSLIGEAYTTVDIAIALGRTYAAVRLRIKRTNRVERAQRAEHDELVRRYWAGELKSARVC
jgi:hypothetical protein